MKTIRLFTTQLGDWRIITGRTAQFLVGMILLLAGLSKAWEPALLFWNMVPYAELLGLYLPEPWRQPLVVHWHLLGTGALLLIPIEMALGTALVCNWRPRLVLPTTLALLLTFTALLFAVWKAGGTDSCGCFGTLVERSPGQAVVEDLALVGLLLIGWLAVQAQAQWNRLGLIVLVALVAGIALSAARLASQAERLGDSDLRPGVHLTGLHPQGKPLDLQKGDLLLELINPTCSHCGVSISLINDYLRQSPSLQAVALTMTEQDTPEMRYFQSWWHPHFPIVTISRTDFLRLTNGHQTPRLALLHNGVIVSVWERDDFQSLQQFAEELNGSDSQRN